MVLRNPYVIAVLVSRVILLGLTATYPTIAFVFLWWLILLGIAVGEVRGRV